MRLLFACLLLFEASTLRAQETPTASDSLFIVTFTTGPAWDTSKSPGEQPFFKEHSANLGNWHKEGAIRFGARYSDKGIIFLSAPTMTAARERIGSDPAVVNKLFLADVQRLRPFYYGCIEKPIKK